MAGLSRPAFPFLSMKSTENQPDAARVPECYTVAQLCRRLNLGRTTVSHALNRGDLEHFRIGARVLVPAPAVVAWLDRHRVRCRA